MLEQLVDERAITDIAADENVSRVIMEAREVLEVASVGEFVEVDDWSADIGDPVENEVATDEPGAAGDKDGHCEMCIDGIV